MPTPVARTRGVSASTPVSQPVELSSTSSTQRFSGSGNSFTLSGTNRMAATVTITVGRERFKASVPANSSPERALETIQRQLPSKLTMKITFAADHIGGPAGFEIYQKGTKPFVEAMPAPRGSSDLTRVTESWGRTDRRGVVSSPPLWYTKWKMGGVAPPKTLSGVFRAGEELVIVIKKGKVDSNFTGTLEDENGKALNVVNGKVSDAPATGWRSSNNFSRVTETWTKDRSGNSTQPLWYLRWKFLGTPPPKEISGVFRTADDKILIVKAGKVDSKFDGMIKDQNGKALIVTDGEISGMQG